MASIFRRPRTLEELNVHSRNTAVSHLGIAITEIGEDFLRGTMPVDQRTKQPYGLLHGGSSAMLAETLASVGANMCVEKEGQQAVGLELNCNHVRAVTQGVVTGTARPVHVGRKTQVWDIRIEDERGKVCCVSRLTLAVIETA
ncbi:MAG TPA: hotdog fold thioesterase [Arenimonas sp.]|nr:hotdog fold thioesterase [Arenimonas sp.]HOZ06514.1 hotdog fold thioesterase [Arenimonas sp.]HPO23838.1 hotdog fold thioesterase [Arenimonas sp.]HPW33379.1 hotdog fold thioesterase [Arenimonas sp.]